MRFGRVSLTATAAAVVLAAMSPAGVMAQATAPAADAAPPAMGANIAAIVNDDIITTYDVEQRALLVAVSSGVRPTQENQNALLQQALRGLIDERLELQELRHQEKEQKFSIVADEKDVDQELADIAHDNNTTPEAMAQQLSGMGIDVSTLREQIRANTSWQRWISGRYGSRIRIGNEQIDQAIARQKASLAKPQFAVSEIFLDASKAGGMQQAVDGAKQLIAQIEQGAPFPAVARQFSSAATAANGGDLGWIGAAELRPELSAVLDSLPMRKVSQPITVSDGVYILLVRDKRAGGTGTTMLRLKQAAFRLTPDSTEAQVAEANKQLAALTALHPTCADLEAKTAQVPGLTASDLGETDVNQLASAFRSSIEGLPENQPSSPLRTTAGLHVLLVCGRKAVDAPAPQRDQIEGRLRAEQLSMISRRSLRDLRNSATIETP